MILADVTDPSSVRRAARHTADLIATTTGGRLNLLVNNAGIGAPPGQPAATAEGPLAELRAEAMHRVLAVNAIAPALVTQALTPLLAAGNGSGGQGANEGGGIVANISSDLGSITNATQPGGSAYAMSKAALNMLTRKLAAELAPKSTTVVAVHPGSIRTRLGGPSAATDAHTAARDIVGLLRTIDITVSGHFLTCDGSELPW